jgi:Tol biopolymer transport system component
VTFSTDGTVWIHELSTGVTSQLATNLVPAGSPGFPAHPVWSPDGRTIFYGSPREGRPNLYARDVRASGPERTVLRDTTFKIVNQVSPDGRLLIYSAQTKPAGEDRGVWVLPLSGGTPVKIALAGGGVEPMAQVSPDGRWIASVSAETGRADVYVQSFPEPGFRQQVSKGGTAPRWSADGRRLFYVSDALKMMSVAVQHGGTALVIGAPRELFQTELASGGTNAYEYAVAPDGRFLMTTTGGASAPPLSIIVNWTSTLKPRN